MICCSRCNEKAIKSIALLQEENEAAQVLCTECVKDVIDILVSENASFWVDFREIDSDLENVLDTLDVDFDIEEFRERIYR